MVDANEEIILIETKEKLLETTRKAISKSIYLSALIENNDGPITIPINDHDSDIVELTVEYLNYFKDKTPQDIEKPLISANMNEVTDAWSAQFIDKLSVEKLTDITVIANALSIAPLLDLSCAKLAAMCKDKSEEEIFRQFGVNEPLTEEERVQIREENAWIEDNI
jgi:hypothetical protein